MTIDIDFLRTRTAHYWNILCRNHDVNYAVPAVYFNTRLKTTAGYAKTNINLNSGWIEINPRSLSIDNVDKTIAHEVSHVFANLYYRQNCGHNNLWSQTFASLGFTPDRCHKIPELLANKRRNSRYRINCIGCSKFVTMTPQLYNKVVNGGGNWIVRCPHCKSANSIHTVMNAEKIGPVYSGGH